MAMGNLGVQVTEYSELQGRFDVLGFFNTLDHQDRPLAALDRAVAAARAVVVETHPDEEAGRQHLFVINAAIVRTCADRGWFVEDFSDEIPSNNRFFLIASTPPSRSHTRSPATTETVAGT
jgi:hypothetical protein